MMLLASTILAALASPALAAECHTLREARTLWPNSHLRYSIEGKKAGGRQCWSQGSAVARVIRAPMPRPDTEYTPQQRINSGFMVFIIIEYDPPCWVNIVPRRIGLHWESYLCRLPPEAF